MKGQNKILLLDARESEGERVRGREKERERGERETEERWRGEKRERYAPALCR